MSGVHVLALAAILLVAAVVRSTELYTSRYQTLPTLDWLESRPPLEEAASVPSAMDLARGIARTMPLLVIRDDARTQLPVFGPPSSVQQVVGGVRDAARIDMISPGAAAPNQAPVMLRLDVIVFNRELRANEWALLMGRAMDIRDPDSGLPQVRMAGPDERDTVWLPVPGPALGGVATVAGHRGPIGFVLQVTLPHDYTTDAAHAADLSARAEVLARRAAADWTTWAVAQTSA